MVSINGNPIDDVLDYRFYMTDRQLQIELLRQNVPYIVKVHKGEYDDLGLEFDTYLMDKQQNCKNKCIFCFVDQTPKGMRESLYFKDDDARLSFLFGNYITLTNLEDRDIQRIIRMRISPINISVHTTNPQLRVEMMKNPRAASSLRYIQMLTEGGIKVNTQLDLCPGINDGEELSRSLRDLGALGENLQSIACVPVGLTDYREGLYPLRTYTAPEAAAVIDTIDAFADEVQKERGVRVAYPSDEFFLLAGRPIPPVEYYGEFDQLDNGVGLMAQLEQEFTSACSLCDPCPLTRKVSIATGVLAYPLLCKLAGKAQELFPGLTVEVHRIVNDYFGHNITVAGLITGTDLMAQLKGKDLGEALLIPNVMLRHEQDMFLDDVTLEEAQAALGTPIQVVENDGFSVLSAMTGQEI